MAADTTVRLCGRNVNLGRGLEATLARYTSESGLNLMDTLGYVSCTATSKQSGQRCKRRPIPGGTVCVMHGGGTPRVRKGAGAAVAPAIPRH